MQAVIAWASGLVEWEGRRGKLVVGSPAALGVVCGTAVVAFGAYAFLGSTVMGPGGAGGAQAAESGGGGGINPDMFAPAGWTDTVDSRDFSAEWSVAVSGVTDAAGTSPVGINNLSGTAHGGQILPYAGTADRMLDSMTLPGAASPPYMWEHRYPGTNVNNSVDIHLNFSNGNGSAAGTVTGRIYVRMSLVYEAASMCVGCVDYTMHGNGEKIFRLSGPAEPLLDWQLGGLTLVNTASNGGACGEPYSNAWYLYQNGDTLPENSNCPQRGALTAEDFAGGVVHLWMCLDATPADGSEINSFGVVSESQSGIAGYWDDDNIVESWSSMYRNPTYGGGNPPWPPNQSVWLDDWIVLTGSSGSCVNPFA